MHPPPTDGGPPSALPPSVLAARRAKAPVRPVGSGGRAYPAAGEDADDAEVQLAATRALLVATEPHEVAAVVATLVRDLGGGLVPARLAHDSAALPLDVSLGLSEPLLPWVEPVSVARMRLSRVLPVVLADARRVLDRLHAEARRAEESERDPVTGLTTRRAWMRRLRAATAGDAVCLVRLHDDTPDGPRTPVGDDVLRAVAALLRQVLRPEDACGRFGPDELACLAHAVPPEVLAGRLDRVRDRWRQERPDHACAVGLRVGVAAVRDLDPVLDLRAADRAQQRVRTGDGTAVATDAEHRSDRA